MLSDDKTIKLWQQLSNAFNVHVRDIGVGRQANGDECTLVTLDDKTDPVVISGLPKKFANEKVEYQTSGPIASYAGCGQPGHQCACGSVTPKP